MTEAASERESASRRIVRKERSIFIHTFCPASTTAARACECNVCTCADSDLRKLRALAIEGTPYILTELSFEKEWEPRLFDRLDGSLQNELIPVIAHAGLYPAVRKNPRCLQI